ncbi:hypothetical protein VI817_010230 [Penicillium citrinum]|nr:hypothetical protein VI817_010230 [Penicillium citrinum]
MLENVLVVGIEPIRVKIADFGISKITRRDEANTAEQSSKISGTHGYIAPERLPQVSGTEPVNSPAVDVWSLGCLAYALLTGKLPFMDKTEYDYTSLKSYYQGSKEFPKGPLVKRRVSQSGQHFVQRLLAPSPQNRPDASEKIMTSWELSEAPIEEMTSTIELDDTPVPQPAARTSQELFVLSSVQRNLASRPTMDLPSSELWYLMKSEKSALVDRDRLEILLLSHANPNIHFKGYTALHVASEQGSLSSLRELLRFAADPTIHTEYNQESVIHLATAQGDATIFSKKLQILLEWGAEINAKNRDGDTALHYLICRIGDPELIVSFLAKGASIEIKGRCGRTPLQYAIFLEQEEIASILLDHDANPFCEDESGVTPLHLAMQSKKLSTAIVERLIGDGSCINQEDKSHRTPLFEAAAYGRHDFIRLLVANGARCSPNSAELESRINQAQSQWRFKVRLPWSA